MLPKPVEYRFSLDNASYVLVEWDRGGEKRIRADYAMAIAAAPAVMESIDGADLYAEAVARECLREAPDIFWEIVPPMDARNGSSRRVVNLNHIPRALWQLFREEIDRFLGQIFPPLRATIDAASGASAPESDPVAPAQAVSPLLRGRAG